MPANETDATRGIAGGKPSDIDRATGQPTASAPAKPSGDRTQQAAAPSSSPIGPNKAGDKSDAYANAAIKLVTEFQAKGTTYGPQTDRTKDGSRNPDFMTDDSECDCTKFVLRALLNADNINYNTGTWAGLRVPAFGGADLKDVTAVPGMNTVIDRLVTANKA